MINDSSFPSNPKKALINGFKEAEKHFLNECMQKSEEQRRLRHVDDSDDKNSLKYLDWSGSCAIVALFVNEQVIFIYKLQLKKFYKNKILAKTEYRFMLQMSEIAER